MLLILQLISTHSLTRRLTEEPTISARDLHISTHSLTRRLTSAIIAAILESSFQLTASQGGWLRVSYFYIRFQSFQLTASQGGWRIFTSDNSTKFWHFNSQPHKEADTRPYSAKFKGLRFQLTASQGGWRTASRTVQGSCPHFNSQPHKEADSTTQNTATVGHISTHSLTRRLTNVAAFYNTHEDISTHSLTRRLTV